MNPIIQKAVHVMLMSGGLAALFNFLFFGKLVGVSLFIFVMTLLAVVFMYEKRQQIDIHRSWWLVGLIALFSLLPAMRANEFLTFLNICAAFGLLLLLAHHLVGIPAWLMKFRDYIFLAVLVPFRMLGKALSTVSLVSQVHSTVKHRDVWIQALKGVIMAVPVLLLFGVLFSQADLAFSQFVKNYIDITISERTLQYIAVFIFSLIASVSFLSYIFFSQKDVSTASAQVQNKSVPNRGIEVLVFLGLIAGLFVLFIGFQITYLFGGEINIVNAGFTYAEYARRGFWELLAVAFISLLVLLAAEKYAGSESKKDGHFLIPALVVIAEVIIVIVSAFKRLMLYIDAYGMTDLRFYVAVFIVLLFVLFILVSVKFILSKPEQFFVFGTMLSFTGCLLVINLINPDAFIARANIRQLDRSGKIDILYASTLSADAASEKLELYNKLQGDDKSYFLDALLEQQETLQQRNSKWQSANVSRARAERLLHTLQ